MLRGFERDSVALYELAHDHLAAEIATWISEEEMGAKLARELLRRAMDNWLGAKLLVQPEVLALIHERREELKRLASGELELLFRSALGAGYEAAYWTQRAHAGGVPVDEILLAGLKDDNFHTRAATLNVLGQLGERRFVEPSIERLEDDYPQVRMAAIRALEKLRPDGEWRERLVYECYVPAGPFIMGDDNGESSEKPAHEVTLDAFYTGKYPVTNAEYKRYTDDAGRPFEILEVKERHPVVNVSWFDACDYAAWAGMRLLTEAEWEKAASWVSPSSSPPTGGMVGGQKRKYPWGDKFDKHKCNANESGIGTTTLVGKYSPGGDSPYGCVDMAGNVWEWVADWYDGDYYGRSPSQNPTGPETGRFKVLRGGSFYFGETDFRAALRGLNSPDHRYCSIGFRCSAVLPGR